MSIVSSNMISKHYCPKCKNFDLSKLHRSFVQKRILGSENKLQCKACGEIFKNEVFKHNLPKDVPIFIEAPTPDLGLNTPSKLTEKPLYDPPYRVAVEHEQSDISMVPDNTILIKKNRGIGPYFAGLALILGGVAYALVWMPMHMNAEKTDIMQVDMHIEKLPQRLVSAAQQRGRSRTILGNESLAVTDTFKSQRLPLPTPPIEVVIDEPQERVELKAIPVAPKQVTMATEHRVLAEIIVQNPLGVTTQPPLESSKEIVVSEVNNTLIEDFDSKTRKEESLTHRKSAMLPDSSTTEENRLEPVISVGQNNQSGLISPTKPSLQVEQGIKASSLNGQQLEKIAVKLIQQDLDQLFAN